MISSEGGHICWYALCDLLETFVQSTGLSLDSWLPPLRPAVRRSESRAAGRSRRAVERVREVQPLLCLAPPLAVSKECHEQYQIARLCVWSSSAGAELRHLPLASDRSRQLGTRLRPRAEGMGGVRWPRGVETRCRRWPDVPQAPSARIPATGQRRRHPAPASSGSFRSRWGAGGSRPGSVDRGGPHAAPSHAGFAPRVEHVAPRRSWARSSADRRSLRCPQRVLCLLRH